MILQAIRLQKQKERSWYCSISMQHGWIPAEEKHMKDLGSNHIILMLFKKWGNCPQKPGRKCHPKATQKKKEQKILETRKKKEHHMKSWSWFARIFHFFQIWNLIFQWTLSNFRNYSSTFHFLNLTLFLQRALTSCLTSQLTKLTLFSSLETMAGCGMLFLLHFLTSLNVNLQLTCEHY